jgi:multidrug resistance efflux pump
MPGQNLTPIPIPARQRWRDFRVSWLPPLTFMLLVTVIGWMWVRYVAPTTIIGEVETVRANIASVVAGTIQELKVARSWLSSPCWTPTRLTPNSPPSRRTCA